MISYGRQTLSDDDLEAVINNLRTDLITQGPVIKDFENAISEYTQARYVTSTSHGTSALHLACLALGLQAADTVWTSPISFVASANCALYCGATIDFVDINASTLNIDIDLLEDKLKTSKTPPKILIVVHMAGLPCEMQSIHELSRKYGFYIIEDAAHALGAQYLQKPVGSCEFSDLTIFSFHPVKSITTGEGGAVTTNRKALDLSLKKLRNHGLERDFSDSDEHRDEPWYYEQSCLGFNYRLTDFQAALGVSQLKKLDTFIEKRQSIFNYYQQHLNNLPLQLPVDDSASAFHLYIIQLKENSAIRRKALYHYLVKNGIKTNVHYIPIHLQPFYQKLGFRQGDFPVAERYYQRALTLPLFPELSINNCQQICQLIDQFFND